MALKFWVTAPFFYPDMDRPWADLMEDMFTIVDAAEELGFEGITINENHFQNYVSNPSSLAFSMLAASRTKRLKVVPGVVVLPNYHPLLVASEMSMLDHIAPGRAGLGVARGGGRYQFDRIGIDPGDARAIYEESVDILRRVWLEDDVSHEGKFYSFPSTTIVPKPLTKPHPPIWAAAQSVEGAKRVAELGLNLITAPNFGTFEPHGDLEALLEAFNEAAEHSEHPRGEVMVLRHTWVGETEADATAFFDDLVNEYNHYMTFVRGSGSNKTREDRLKARSFSSSDSNTDIIQGGHIEMQEQDGIPTPDQLWEKYDDPVLTTPDRMIERFKTYEEMGVDHVACLVAVGMPAVEVVKNMELMAKKVFPAFAESEAVSSPA
jgi:alkanesulfonate monooxygenase SsuD/methylene tetrahydromethanopterin reductase-like flavin-dependent oxidoreductase (luciferase family)